MSAFPGIEAGGVEPPALLRLLRAAASLKCTLALLALLLPAIVLAYNFEQWRSWPLAVPLAGLSLNLIASVATNPAFRRQSGLLVFHLSLCGLLALVAVGRLTWPDALAQGSVQASGAEAQDVAGYLPVLRLPRLPRQP